MKLRGTNHWPLLVTWLDFGGQGYSRPSRWRRHPRRHCGIEVRLVFFTLYYFFVICITFQCWPHVAYFGSSCSHSMLRCCCTFQGILHPYPVWDKIVRQSSWSAEEGVSLQLKVKLNLENQFRQGDRETDLNWKLRVSYISRRMVSLVATMIACLHTLQCSKWHW